MTKTATAELDAPQAEYKELEHGPLDLEDITVVSNVRKHFDEKRLAELAESIKTHGLHNPIIVRPNDGEVPGARAGRYILVAGERRLRAAKLAGHATILARVLDLDAAAAAELQAMENLQREGLSPIEEAEAFKTLMAKGGMTAADLASRVGKQASYVYRAVALLELPKAVLEALEAGTITPAHGHQLLRLPPEKREEWLGNAVDQFSGGVLPAKVLAESIDNELGQDLKKAPWPKDEPFGYFGADPAPACATCPSNTGNQGMLFDGATAGRCLNRECYATKVASWGTVLTARTEAKAGKEGVPFVGAAKAKMDYSVQAPRLKGHVIVKTEDLPAKGKREGYGLGVNLDGMPAMVWVKLEGEKSDKKAPAAAQHDWRREQFIDDKVRRALSAARIKVAAKTKASRKTYESIAEALLSNDAELAQEYAEAIGQKSLVVKKLTHDQLAGLLVAGTYGASIEVPNERALVAATKKAAAKEYAELLKAGQAKHRSIGNGGSVVMCGIKGLSYDKATEQGIAVPSDEETTCPECLERIAKGDGEQEVSE